MSAVPEVIKRKLTIEAYHALADAGILTERDRVELIEGEIIEMAPVGGPHIRRVNVLTQLLVTTLTGRAIVSVQNPVEMAPHSEPEPDFTILRYRADFYGDARPTRADTLWIIEVADSSVRYDRSIKVPLYAKHGIPEFWIINVGGQCIEVFRQPHDSSYAETFEVRAGEKAAPLAFPDLAIQWEVLFGSGPVAPTT
jgi:Uma2 family endonuclease